MKRIMVAVVLALLLHAFLFYMKPEWQGGIRTINEKPPAVTISMSYQKPVVPPIVQKAPAQLKTKEIIRTVKKVKKTVATKIQTPAIAPVKEAEIKKEELVVEGGDATGTNIPMASGGSGEVSGNISSDNEEGGSEVIYEAEPLYKMNPEPPYPRMAKKRGYQGTVLLSVLVTKEGRVENLWVFESSGYNILDNAALEAVKDWLFEPGKQGYKPVDMWVQVPVRFEIK
jgi:periplasmic protein TonB